MHSRSKSHNHRKHQHRPQHRKTRSESLHRHNHYTLIEDRPPKPPPKPLKQTQEDIAFLSDPRIFRTQSGGIGFACTWKIDWTQYDEERGTSWLFSTGLPWKAESYKKWKPCL